MKEAFGWFILRRRRMRMSKLLILLILLQFLLLTPIYDKQSTGGAVRPEILVILPNSSISLFL